MLFFRQYTYIILRKSIIQIIPAGSNMSKPLSAIHFTKRLSRVLYIGIAILLAVFTFVDILMTRQFVLSETEHIRRILVAEIPEILNSLDHKTQALSDSERIAIVRKHLETLTLRGFVTIEIHDGEAAVALMPCRETHPLILPFGDRKVTVSMVIHRVKINQEILRLSALDLLSLLLVLGILWILLRYIMGRLAQPMIDAEADAAAQAERELDVARDIQSRIRPVPAVPFPERPKLELGATLLQSCEVGGDFYDYIKLDNAHIFIAAGDAAGVGISAALMMVIGRTILHNAIMKHRHTAYALTAVNQEIASQDTPIPVAIFCGVLNIYTGRLHWASAGYPAPTVYGIDGKVKERLVGDTSPAGERKDGIYTAHTMQLEPGETLVVVSDGLVTAEDAKKTPFSLDRVDRYFEANKDVPAEKFVEGLTRVIQRHIGGEIPRDDVTLLALRSHYIVTGDVSIAPADAQELTLHNDLKQLTPLMEWLETNCADKDIGTPFQMVLNLVIEEWFVNIVSYAFGDNPDAHEIKVRLWFTPDALWLQFEDDGTAYDPTARKEVDIDRPLEERKIGGLGVHFIRQTMDIFNYVRRDEKNVVTFMKRTDVPLSNP